MKNCPVKVCILFVLFFEAALPQSDSTGSIDTDLIDDLIVEPAEETDDNSDAYETLEYLVANPVNINSADVFELQKIPFVDLNIANQIINYRNKYGNIFSLDELSAIEGMSGEIIKNISPYVIFERNIAETGSIKNNFDIKFRHRTIEDLQQREGYKDNYYLGSPYKFYNRLQSGWNNKFGMNFLTEKDPGENSVYDFLSLNVWAKDISHLKFLIAGDYSLSFGQGLLLSGPYGNSKGTEATGYIIKRFAGLQAYRSTNENNFFRGSAAAFQLGKFTCTAFYSKNYFDGSIDSLTRSITSISVSGYHRTENEIANKKNSFENSLGTNLNYSVKDFFNAGGSIFHSTFSSPINYDNKEFISDFTCYSFYYDFYFRSTEIAGELASDGMNWAFINHLQLNVTKEIDFITSFRYYPPDYKNIHGLGFGKNSDIKNEIGFYSAVSWASKIGRLSLSFDQYNFPNPSSNNILPAKGNELNFYFTSKKFSNSNISLRYRYSKGDVLEDAITNRVISQKQNHRVRIEIKNFIKDISIKTRFEYFFTALSSGSGKEKGMMVMEDLKLSPLSFLKLSGRLMLFKTNSFFSSIYEYEDDFNGIIRSYALYGEGLRWYLLLRLIPLKGISIAIKYSETYKPGENYLSSGYSMIEGSLDNLLGLQLDISL